jgi:hypothetical protein
MIPVEYIWLTLFALFGLIGLTRGPSKELGATAVLSLTLFVLKLGWDEGGATIIRLVQGRAPDLTGYMVMALYYGILIIFVGYVSYEGVTLSFAQKLLFQEPKSWFLVRIPGLIVGLLNGYLVIGTLWNVLANARYFRPLVTIVSRDLTHFHNQVVRYLPVSVMDSFTPFLFLGLGMILILAMVLK